MLWECSLIENSVLHSQVTRLLLYPQSPNNLNFISGILFERTTTRPNARICSLFPTTKIHKNTLRQGDHCSGPTDIPTVLIMVFFAVLFAGAAVHVANAEKKDRRKLAEMEIYSRKTLHLPKRLSGMPRAMSRRSVTARELRLSDRELCFDEDSGTLYAQAPDSVCTLYSRAPGEQEDDSSSEALSEDASSEASDDTRYAIYDC